MNYLRILKVVFKIKKRLLFPIPIILILVFSIYHFVNETEGNTRYSTELNWGLDTINAPLLWNKNINQSNNVKKVKISILDSGVDKEHTALKGLVKAEFNAINSGEPTNDILGHGTAVAGIIAAQNNEKGLMGVSPNVELYSAKVLDNEGNGTLESIVKGIKWSIENEVDIINLSFGISKDKPLLEKTIKEATNNGIIVIASAGNRFGGEVDFPATYDNVFSISAVDRDNKIASFASKGKIDFVAPGVDIPILRPNNNYGFNSGTSFATPHVTGIVSLILQNSERFGIKKREDIHSQIYRILKDWSYDLGKKGKDETFGEGLIIIK